MVSMKIALIKHKANTDTRTRPSNFEKDPTQWCPEPPEEGIDAISFPSQVLT